ncbi:hypothetical protein RHGRI_029706 [Rhododendron griersonianum]|uniref:Uncharacterized protein n=1 Tax=Rhododendron griersonianum TaxID=479676 RepID=A0AAV6IKF6_9ERIC|nr:hypothetical protein RHGRI_029706 [Rhododendron griersonianum]
MPWPPLVLACRDQCIALPDDTSNRLAMPWPPLVLACRESCLGHPWSWHAMSNALPCSVTSNRLARPWPPLVLACLPSRPKTLPPTPNGTLSDLKNVAGGGLRCMPSSRPPFLSPPSLFKVEEGKITDCDSQLNIDPNLGNRPVPKMLKGKWNLPLKRKDELKKQKKETTPAASGNTSTASKPMTSSKDVEGQVESAPQKKGRKKQKKETNPAAFGNTSTTSKPVDISIDDEAPTFVPEHEACSQHSANEDSCFWSLREWCKHLFSNTFMSWGSLLNKRDLDLQSLK